jgi:seipin
LLETVKDGFVPAHPSDSAPVLARSRRSAILQYRSLPVEMIHRVTQLPWYVLGVRDESEKLTIDVFESVSFARGSNAVPAALKLEVQSSGRMQVYSARAVFRARFRGLRWLMYNHRIISAVIFVGVFWSVEMVFAGIAWAVLVAYLGPAFKMEERRPMRIKDEATSEDEEHAFLSDTERTFPTLSNQQPLRFRSPEVKEEKKDETPSAEVRLQDVPPLTSLEADDEDEDGDYFLDSGIGTSMESGSGSRPGSMRKRRGRSGFRE